MNNRPDCGPGQKAHSLAAVAGVLLLCLPLAIYAIDTDSVDLPDILWNLQRSLPGVWRMLVALTQLLGVGCFVLAIMKLRGYGVITVMMRQGANMGPTLMYILVGTVLLFLPETLDTAMETFWQYDYSSVKSWHTTGKASWDELLQPMLILIRVIGLVAFIRGWTLMLRVSAQNTQPGTAGKAIMHIIGGILAINIVGTISMLEATFGLQ
jgi:intracellular multiplication protein IcmC